MRIYKFFTLLMGFFLFFSIASFANNNPENKSSVEFFASNNTKEIDLRTAFNRLKGNEQQVLHNKIIDLMQKEHIEQGKFEDLLGTYRMSSDQNLTADNSEVFITSPYQKISTEKAFNLARKLANSLNQESVAVLVSSKQPIIGDVILKVKSHRYSINEMVKTIHKRLPILYNQAFSLYLNNTCLSMDNATVKEIEWIGSKIKPGEIKKSFPNDEISFHYAKAYLIYKNGQKQEL